MPYAMRALAEAEPASKGEYATCFYVQQGRQCGTRSRQSLLMLLASVLQAASPPKAREPWKPRPGDGISSNWLIAELTHRQAHESKLPYRS